MQIASLIDALDCAYQFAIGKEICNKLRAAQANRNMDGENCFNEDR